jgi:capsular polysaccharide biosynthesis protein
MEEEDSIELIELLSVVWRRRWFIIILTLACAVAAGIISFAMPKMYEVYMLIEPGVIDISPDGKFIYLDSALNIKSKIETQAYNIKIYKELKLNPKRLNLKFKTIQPRESKIVKTMLEVKDVNKGIQVLSALFQQLVKEYQHYIDLRKSELQEKMEMVKRQLEVDLREKDYLEKEIDLAKANNDMIINERNMLIKKVGSNPDKLALLIYTNIIQQNMAHYNDLREQLAWLMGKIEEMKSEIETLKIKKNSIENIRLIQPPQSSIYPIKPKKELNVMLAFFAGLFISIFLAFFLEYIKKTRSISNKS